MIENSTNETSAPHLHWIGATYASTAAISALICSPVLLIISIDKKLINSFYFYSMHQLMADFLSLCSFGVYGGLVLTFGTNFEWFMIFVSWTRFMVLRDRQIRSNSITIENWTTKFKHYSSCLIVWLSYACLYSTYFFTQKPIYLLDFTVYSWRYAEGPFFIRFLKNYDLYHNLLTSILLIMINGASLVVVRLRLRETRLVKETAICTQ
uniref:Uncharacterized protein n=1 Tax=Romanomermis culicivorax TaxID=13658 RepID=A0A915ICR1_ROMCU